MGINVSMIEPTDGGVNTSTDNFDASFMNQAYQKVSLGPLGGVFMKRSAAEELHFEVPHNVDAKLYDEAVELL